MLTFYNPSIKCPSATSPDWYKRYYNSFIMSQLMGRLFSSVLDSYSHYVCVPELMATRKITGFPHFDIPAGDVDPEILTSHCIEHFVDIISNDIERTPDNMHTVLQAMGLSFNGIADEKEKIDYENVKNSICKGRSWSSISSGFLNIWEFMFVFSITESTLKEISGNADAVHLVKNTNSKFPGVFKFVNDIQIDAEFSESVWRMYTKIRNIYAHHHGIISKNSRKSLSGEIISFRSVYDRRFHDSESYKMYGDDTVSGAAILSAIVPEADDLFKDDEFIDGSIFFISDHELNIFRRFCSSYMSSLSSMGEKSVGE